MEKLINTAAICGAEVTKEQNPAVPYTVEERVREAKSAYEAGAAILHIHVREDDGTPTQGLVGMDAAAVLVRDAYLTLAERARPTLPSRPTGADGVTPIDICPISGQLAGPHCPHLHDYAATGKGPTTECTWHREGGQLAYPARAQGWLQRQKR